MKKIFAIIVAALLCIGFAGCDTKKDDEKKVFDTNRGITVISRDLASGTREAFEDGVGLRENKVSLLKEGAEELAQTGAVIEKVKADLYAIGYISAGLVSSDVRAMKYEGVAPETANIKNGTYKLQRPFVVVYKPATLENALFADFEKFMRSKTAAGIIAKKGAVALDGTVNSKTYGADYTAAKLTGTITIIGSTSVGPTMQLLREEYIKLNSGVTINITENGSSNGLKAAKDGTATFGMMSKDLDSAETSLVKTQLAIDGVAIIVNTKNTYTNITKLQVQAIYIAEGHNITQIKKWSELK